jgi:hypothetical protein
LTTIFITNFNTFYRTESIVDLINVILPSSSRTILNLIFWHYTSVLLRIEVKTPILIYQIDLVNKQVKLWQNYCRVSTITFQILTQS